MNTVLVVGGGIAGMTAASRLLDLGYDVTIIESAPTLGGLAGTWNIGDLSWDTFYHVVLESDVHTRAMLRDLGMEGEIIWNTAGSGLYADGALHPFSSGADLLRFPGLSLADKLRFGLTILHAAKARPLPDGSDPYDTVSAVEYLAKYSGNRVTEKWWRPLLRAKLGDEYEAASASFIRATIGRLFGARKSTRGPQRFGYVPGGYKRVLDRYEARLRERGARIRTGTRVQNIIEHADGVRADTSNGEFVASRAIVTTPSSIAMKLLPQLNGDLRNALQADRYMGVICVSIVTKESLGPYYVTNIADPSIPITGIINMSALVTDATVRSNSFAGNALSYIPKYLAADDPLFEQNDDAIVASFLPYIYRIYPHVSEKDVLVARVARARHVFPYPEQGRIGRVKRMNPAHYADRRIVVVNAARLMHAVLNVNDTITVIEDGISALSLEKKELYEATRRAIA